MGVDRGGLGFSRPMREEKARDLGCSFTRREKEGGSVLPL